MGNFFETKSMSKGLGDLEYKNAHDSRITSSLDLPLPEEVFGYMAIIDSNRRFVYIYDVVISALLCRPKASGLGFRGICFI